MKTARLAVAFAAVLALRSVAMSADPGPREPGDGRESGRYQAVRTAYFPFLAVGHGLLLTAQYGIGYPIYFLTKPAVDFMYHSTDEADDLPTAAAMNNGWGWGWGSGYGRR